MEEENNNQQINNKNDSNSVNNSQGQNFLNLSSNNVSDLFHEFEGNSFNFTKLQGELGEIAEIQKELSSSK